MTGEGRESRGPKGWRGCRRERQVWVTEEERAAWIGELMQTEVEQIAGLSQRTSGGGAAGSLRNMQMFLRVLAHLL